MKVKFLPQNIELEIKPNQSVMNLAHENNLPIRSVCNGMPSCSECRVKLVDGEYNVPPPSRKELNLIGTGYFIDQRRLSCQLYCFGDITVDLAEQLEKTNEGPVPKKFLARANKERAEDYNSVGGVLLEEDTALVKQAEAEVGRAPQPREQRQDQGARQVGGGGQDRGRRSQSGGGRGDNQPAGSRPDGNVGESRGAGRGRGRRRRR
ncbi:MAG: 2Fe-2S iron-sulfur cluster-binding protein [Bdellovibrionales bacterium]